MKYYLFILIAFELQSCMDELAYTLGDSIDITDSQKRHAFVEEYVLLARPDSLQTKYNLYFKEIFIEKLWRYGRTVKKTITKDTRLNFKYQLICIYKEEYMSNYSRGILIINDTVENSHTKNLQERTYGHLSSSAFDTSFLKDTLRFNVYNLKKFIKAEKIGELWFYKKHK